MAGPQRTVSRSWCTCRASARPHSEHWARACAMRARRRRFHSLLLRRPPGSPCRAWQNGHLEPLAISRPQSRQRLGTGAGPRRARLRLLLGDQALVRPSPARRARSASAGYRQQMGWTLRGVLKLLAVYGHGDVGALEEIDRAFKTSVTPLRAVDSDATRTHGSPHSASQSRVEPVSPSRRTPSRLGWVSPGEVSASRSAPPAGLGWVRVRARRGRSSPGRARAAS
jgi:hypothetical protein